MRKVAVALFLCLFAQLAAAAPEVTSFTAIPSPIDSGVNVAFNWKAGGTEKIQFTLLEVPGGLNITDLSTGKIYDNVSHNLPAAGSLSLQITNHTPGSLNFDARIVPLAPNELPLIEFARHSMITVPAATQTRLPVITGITPEKIYAGAKCVVSGRNFNLKKNRVVLQYVGDNGKGWKAFFVPSPNQKTVTFVVPHEVEVFTQKGEKNSDSTRKVESGNCQIGIENDWGKSKLISATVVEAPKRKE